jgi:transcriptional regulator with XRE-family HTH domain
MQRLEPESENGTAKDKMAYLYNGHGPAELADYAALSKHLRRVKGLTQDQLAGELGVTRNTVYRLEAGDRIPNHKTVQSLMNGLRGIMEGLMAEHGVGIRQQLSNVNLGTALRDNNISETAKDNMKQGFRDDVQTNEGESFWMTAGLIGLSYLLLKSLSDD